MTFLSHWLVAVGGQQLPQQDRLGGVGQGFFKDEVMHFAGEKEQDAFAFVDRLTKSPAFAGVLNQGGLDFGGFQCAAEESGGHGVNEVVFHGDRRI